MKPLEREVIIPVSIWEAPPRKWLKVPMIAQ